MTGETSGEKPPLEIERKFLVLFTPDNLGNYDNFDIRQGYLHIGDDGSEVRVREKRQSYTHTQKQGIGLLRGEIELPISKMQFDDLWPETEGRRVEKTRHIIPHNGAIIELDIYDGPLAGHMVAEVEFPDTIVAKAFEPPEWFGVEVTEDAAYKNQSLAVNGWPTNQ